MNKIRAMFIFEMLGKPPEYIKESLGSYVNNLEREGVKILSRKIHEPKLLEREKEGTELFTTFAEVELEIDNITLLFGIAFRLLPSHVEIIEPAELQFKNFDLSAVISELLIKLHKYDEVAKVLTMERDSYAKRLRAIQEKLTKNIKVEEIREKDEIKTEDKNGSEKSKKKK